MSKIKVKRGRKSHKVEEIQSIEQPSTQILEEEGAIKLNDKPIIPLFDKINNEQVINEQIINEQVINEQVNNEQVINKPKLKKENKKVIKEKVKKIKTKQDIDSNKPLNKSKNTQVSNTPKSNLMFNSNGGFGDSLIFFGN
jgi:hypothetical protein